MKVFGVTGTNGKTTVSYMLRSIIKAHGEESALIGTVVHEIGGKLYQVNNTTPGKQLIAEYLAECNLLGIENAIMEVSSHGLEQGRTDEANIAYAAFTNLSRDHLDYHETMEKYYEAKKKLFLYPSVKKGIINEDDIYGRKLLAEVNRDGLEIMTVSMNNKNSDIYAVWEGKGLSGGELYLTIKRQEVKARLAVIGDFAAMDAALAAGLAWSSGVSLATIKCGLEQFSGVPGRSEVIYGSRTGITAIVDYAHTPDALENMLKAAEIIARERRSKLITVFGCGGQRDKEKRKQMGLVAGEFSDICILTNDNPRNEDAEEILAMIEEGIYDTGCPYYKVQDREEALKKAVQLSEQGNIIVIAGKGHEKVQLIGNEEKVFDDREKIKEII